MARPREGFKGRFVELPNEVWEMIDERKAATGLPLAVLIEDAVRRYCGKPPAKLPEPRKVGRKPAGGGDEEAG